MATTLKTICSVHESIMDLARTAMKINPSYHDSPESLFSELETILDDIYSLADQALEMGQNMENRLDEYYEAIKNLGFKRDK